MSSALFKRLLHQSISNPNLLPAAPSSSLTIKSATALLHLLCRPHHVGLHSIAAPHHLPHPHISATTTSARRPQP
ncbi:hypothetical protein Hdeb2414_s0001g00033571 [Helianthus debilis subsp. tardiflorus]